MEDRLMEKLKFIAIVATVTSLSSCAYFKEKPAEQKNQLSSGTAQVTDEAMMEAKNQEAFNRAVELTQGWPQSSLKAATEMISKYGEPNEKTSELLIWKSDIAPFKKIVVHKVVFESKFPLLHQNALEHTVDYKVNIDKVDDALRFNKSLVFNKAKGEMSSFSDSEAMNILALNLADKVLRGQMGAEAARVKYGKEALNYINGDKAEITQVLNFGEQFESADPDETITSKIRWIGDPDKREKQAQEEKKTQHHKKQ